MKDGKKILYVWKSPYPWDVRVEKLLHTLQFAGFDIHLLCLRREDEPILEENNRIFYHRTKFVKDSLKSMPVSVNPFWKKEIKKTVQNIRPDLIIAREIMLVDACKKAAADFGIPVIIDMAEHYPAAMKSWKKYRETLLKRIAVHYLDIPEKTEKNAVNIADGIITVCRQQVKRLVNEYNFPEHKTAIVHNTPIPLSPKIKKRNYNIPPVVFGHHGFMSDEKNLDLLIRAFDLAAKKNNGIKLYLAGTGESEDNLKELSDSLGSRDRINFSGKYDQNELPKIINDIDVGMICYDINDFNNNTIHNKIFDYINYGKPIIITPMKAASEILDEFKCGLVSKSTKPEDISETILEMAGIKSDIFSQNCISAAEKYNWENDAKSLIDFIKRYVN